MAETSNLQRFNNHISRQQTSPSRRNVSNDNHWVHHWVHQEAERREAFYQRSPSVFDFDCNNPSRSFFAPDDSIMTLNLGFYFNAERPNQDSEYADLNCFFSGAGEEDDTEQMNFVADLFESRERLFARDSRWNFDSGRTEDDSGMEFGLAEVASTVGLRVVGMDSESDSEEFEVNSSFLNDGGNDNDGFEMSHYFISENETEEFEWEEVSERIHFDGRENLNALTEGIGEISVSLATSSSEGDEGEVEERNTRWEVLLAMNDFQRNFDFQNPAEENVDRNEVPDYILATEQDTLLNQLVEYENALSGSPAAAKSLVENLPSVVLTKDEMGENYSVIVCAVCTDELAIGEKVTRLPCCHVYHGNCILPWLKIRNTCPVCRHELLTDDADYEKRRNERGGSGVPSSLVDDFQATYDFRLLP